MAEKTFGNYRVGQLRCKYLDMANINFAQGNFSVTDGLIKDFLDTLDGKTAAGETIKKEFDIITLRKQQDLQKLEDYAKSLGYLEQADIKNEGRKEIEINAIHDKKIICWMVAQEQGLFNE